MSVLIIVGILAFLVWCIYRDAERRSRQRRVEELALTVQERALEMQLVLLDEMRQRHQEDELERLFRMSDNDSKGR